MKYLLDTSTVSYALRGIGGINERLRRLSPASVAISAITEAELWYGVEKRNSNKLRKLVSAFIQPLEVIPFDSDAARCYGVINAEIQKNGTPIDMADAMIASIGITRKMTVVTSNVRHFGKIKGLKLENWE